MGNDVEANSSLSTLNVERSDFEFQRQEGASEIELETVGTPSPSQLISQSPLQIPSVIPGRMNTTIPTPSLSDSPLSLPSPGERQHDNGPAPDQGRLNGRNLELRSPRIPPRDSSITSQETEISSSNLPSRYIQAFSIMKSTFGSTLTSAKLIIVIRTGDSLIRDDAVPFLRDQLPFWEGMWPESSLLTPLENDSAADKFVKLSRSIAILKERSTMDRIRILLHRVLQYQFYLRVLGDVKQKAKDTKVRKRGVRDTTYALDHLLQHLYSHDWHLIGPSEKKSRRNLLHRQKHIGKRLLALCSHIGFGILLLGSQEAMGRMKVFPSENRCRRLTCIIVVIWSFLMICLTHWFVMLLTHLRRYQDFVRCWMNPYGKWSRTSQWRY